MIEVVTLPMIIEKVLMPLLVIAIPVLMGWLIRVVKKMTSEQKLNREAHLVVLHDRINHLCDKFIAAKLCTFEDRENLKYLFEVYEKMHGNHGLEDKYKKVMELPIDC